MPHESRIAGGSQPSTPHRFAFPQALLFGTCPLGTRTNIPHGVRHQAHPSRPISAPKLLLSLTKCPLRPLYRRAVLRTLSRVLLQDSCFKRFMAGPGLRTSIRVFFGVCREPGPMNHSDNGTAKHLITLSVLFPQHRRPLGLFIFHLVTTSPPRRRRSIARGWQRP